MVAFFLYSQIYRYRNVSNTTQRYQTRWIVAATVFAISGVVLSWLLLSLFTGLQGPGVIAGQLFTMLIMLLIPLSVAIAVLRYRLFDIVFIVRRTLIYALLTGVLALVYFGSVIVLENISRAVSGSKSPFSIVFSTLVIAFLFSPLRRRIQMGIDRRFYRRQYDARERLNAFAAVARDEVDLAHLTTALVHVVDESLQPASLSVWLKEQQS